MTLFTKFKAATVATSATPGTTENKSVAALAVATAQYPNFHKKKKVGNREKKIFSNGYRPVATAKTATNTPRHPACSSVASVAVPKTAKLLTTEELTRILHERI